MRKMSIRSLLVLAAVVALATSASAAWVKVGDVEGTDVSVVDNSAQRIALEFRVGGFEQTDVLINGRIYAKITLPGEGVSLDRTLPELPVVARSVIIPDDRMMELRVVESEWVDLPGITPIPSKGDLTRDVDPASVPWEFADAYAAGGWYPAEAAQAREPYILRDFRGTAVVVSPFAWSPEANALRVYTRLVVELVDIGPGGANVIERNSTAVHYTVDFENVYENHFLNYGLDKYAMIPEQGSMLIICHDDFAADMQPLVAWKNQRGLPTEMVLKSQVGSTSAQVKTYIQNYYNASSNPKLAFVLLVGDAAQMPTPSSDGGSADPTYGKVVGTDFYPDIFIGRFSAENVAQVQTQVLRTVNYETVPPAGDWLQKGTGIASNQGPGDDGEYDNVHMNNIRTLLMNYGYTTVDQIYDPSGTAAQVAAAINAGRGVINYCGHGSTTSWSTTGFSNTHVNALTNDHLLPFIVAVACVNGQFNGYTCFAEAWLRATHNGNPTGAVATYMSSINQSWNPPMEAEDECADLLVADAVTTFGAYTFNGSCSMIDVYGSGGASMFNTWHIFGDPSLPIRTKPSTAFAAVGHDESISPDATTFTVQTGLAKALAGLSYQGQYLGSAYANASGEAVITIVGTLPEGADITLTVTGRNKLPYVAPVPVAPLYLPQLAYEPLSFDCTAGLDEICLETLLISNLGQESSILNYTATFHPDTPTNFLSISPATGSVPFGETAEVTLTFSSMGMRQGVYTGSIMLDCNGDQDANIPVRFSISDAGSVDGDRSVPAQLVLGAPRPNPIAGEASVTFGLPTAQRVDLTIYDASGRAVRTLARGERGAGYHQVGWDGRDGSGRVLSAGVYFARLEADGQSLTQRVLRVR